MVVTSLVSDIILPPISLLSQSSKNLANYFFVLRQGETPDAVYNTIEQAAADGIDSSPTSAKCELMVGAVFMAWGQFCQRVSIYPSPVSGCPSHLPG